MCEPCLLSGCHNGWFYPMGGELISFLWRTRSTRRQSLTLSTWSRSSGKKIRDNLKTKVCFVEPHRTPQKSSSKYEVTIVHLIKKGFKSEFQHKEKYLFTGIVFFKCVFLINRIQKLKLLDIFKWNTYLLEGGAILFVEYLFTNKSEFIHCFDHAPKDRKPIIAI